MLQNCTADRYAINKARMVRLAEYSRYCLQALRAETGIQYEGRTGGTLQVFRTLQQFDGAERDALNGIQGIAAVAGMRLLSDYRL